MAVTLDGDLAAACATGAGASIAAAPEAARAPAPSASSPKSTRLLASPHATASNPAACSLSPSVAGGGVAGGAAGFAAGAPPVPPLTYPSDFIGADLSRRYVPAGEGGAWRADSELMP